MVGKDADKDCALWTADAEIRKPQTPVDISVRHGDMDRSLFPKLPPKSTRSSFPLELSREEETLILAENCLFYCFGCFPTASSNNSRSIVGRGEATTNAAPPDLYQVCPLLPQHTPRSIYPTCSQSTENSKGLRSSLLTAFDVSTTTRQLYPCSTACIHLSDCANREPKTSRNASLSAPTGKWRLVQEEKHRW